MRHSYPRRHVEVVEEQRRARVRGPRLVEHRADRRDTPELPAHAGKAVVVLVEDGHDHDLIDDVPDVDRAREVADFAPDPRPLCGENLFVRQIEEPWRRGGVPGKRMSLDHAAAVGEPACGGQQSPRVWPTAFGLEVAPVERQRREIEQLEP